GSMREEIMPGHLVVVDQFFDRTRRQPASFFGTGLVAHVQLADPVCNRLRGHLLATVRAAGAVVHDGGTYLCMEGPAFSTRAESRIYRSWGVDVIGMTNIPEAKLAREAELCFATLALATDYDCWHETEADVSVDVVLAILAQNTAMAKKIIRLLAETLTAERSCACPRALQGAILTYPQHVDPAMRDKLDLLVGRYLPGGG
ncbi:MAG: S-methyl-5'-thioadenosine phosphorylase, partial [Deltaproteobacteria bacterium]|nr:S-methyl-5'-thioadenosine phosphorylase [Deltaproteobacteria bacterium]